MTLSACVHDSKLPAESSLPSRQVASAEDVIPDLNDESPRLVYITYAKSGQASREEISSDRWNGQNDGFSDSSREHYLKMLYFANTRKVSLKGIRHAACFEGSAQKVSQAFFEPKNNQGLQNGRISHISTGFVETKSSSDGRLLGISFEHEDENLRTASFRMFNCNAGKGTISDDAGPVLGPQAYLMYKKPSRGIASDQDRNLVAAGKAFEPKPFDLNYGFRMLDKTEDPKTKRRFATRGDFHKAPAKPVSEEAQLAETPWKGLKIRSELPARTPNQIESLKLALMAQKYFYENMANQSPNPDDNFIADKNTDRYWCHMPWMHVGNTGREAIHGLTQERDMKKSATIPTFANATAGSNWGVAYFNAPGCRTLNQVFGNSINPLPKPDFTKGQFENGTLIAKILFTTANFPAIKGAFTWNANVSEPGSSIRRIKPVRHIQMDIAIRDSSIQGVSANLSDWLMIGYYYDPDYDYDKEIKPLLNMENPLKEIPGLPKAFFKMRPAGVQTGFDTPEMGDTVVFPGAYTNGLAGRLNGPADNPKSSCMSCHGTAGISASMVPGFLTEKMFNPFVGKMTLDFNLQLALARSNYETEMKQ